MAYGNKYDIRWAGKDLKGHLYLDKDAYAGAVDTSVRIPFDSISYNYLFGDWNEPVIGMQLEFEIVNDKANYFTLDDLLTSTEGEYKVRLVVDYPTTYTLFEGFLNCDTVTQKYLQKQNIKFVASSYLSKLENDHPISIDTLQNKTFIDIIDEILVSTGASYNIKINSTLHAEGDVLSAGKSLFNLNGFNTELFWEDEVERKSSLDILKTILTTFECYLYWWGSYWYIERYEDIWKESVSYIEYTTGTPYAPTGTGAVVAGTKSINRVHYDPITKTGLRFIQQSQNRHSIPGLKSIQINLEDKKFLNLVKADLTNIGTTSTAAPTPDYRTWLRWVDGDVEWAWATIGQPKSNISNSICRIAWGGIQGEELVFDSFKGLYTQFKITVTESTELKIAFKYAVDRYGTIAPWSNANSPSLDGFIFHFPWYLRSVTDSEYITQPNIEVDSWIKSPKDTELRALQYIQVNGSSFNPKTNTVDVSVTIPIGKVVKQELELPAGLLIGDISLVLCIGSEVIKKQDVADSQPNQAWFGDFEVTATDENQNNVIEGKISTKFLNKKTIPLSLYDSENVNYKNGIVRGSDLSIRTEKWGTTGEATEIVQKGVVWSTIINPTVALATKTLDGAGTDTFTSLITGLSPGTTYYVRSYFTDALGDTYYGNEIEFATTALVIGSPYMGGKIGYLYQPGDGPYDANVVHGIIVSDYDISYLFTSHPGKNFWCSLQSVSSNNVSCDTILGLGTHDAEGGRVNSDLMNDNAFVLDYAIHDVALYDMGNYTDWKMPSIDELNLIRGNKVALGNNFVSDWYWSSSEPSLDGIHGAGVKAYALNFGNTSVKDAWKKNNWRRVRAVRYF